MKDKNSNWLNLYLIILFIIKIIYLFSIIKVREGKKEDIKFYKNIKEITHSLFFILMSLLIIYLFQPHSFSSKPVVITGETKTFLFIFAILILLGIHYDKLFEEIKNLLKIK